MNSWMISDYAILGGTLLMVCIVWVKHIESRFWYYCRAVELWCVNCKITGLVGIVINLIEFLYNNSALGKLKTLNRGIGNFEA